MTKKFEDAERPWVPTSPYTFTEIAGLLQSIVASKPADYRYERVEDESGEMACLYWHNSLEVEEGEPGCLIGQLLHRLDVPRELLIKCNTHLGGSFSTLIAHDILGPMFTMDTAWVLRMTQIKQDDGLTWDQCLQFAESMWAGVVYARGNPA